MAAANAGSAGSGVNMLTALGAIPAGAALTRTQILEASGRSPDTARSRLATLVAQGRIEEVVTSGGKAYRLPQTVVTNDAQASDDLDELRRLYEQKLKLELRILEVEGRLRQRLGT